MPLGEGLCIGLLDHLAVNFGEQEYICKDDSQEQR